MRYLDCPDGSFPWKIRQLLEDNSGFRGEREGVPSMLATSFAEAAGVAGRQNWGLVLSSSARMSHVTYQTVVGVRYPELVTFNGTSWNFGKFVTHEKTMRGGFLPVFWDVPRADTHAVEDIGAVVDWNVALSMLMPSLAWLSCTIGTT